MWVVPSEVLCNLVTYEANLSRLLDYAQVIVIKVQVVINLEICTVQHSHVSDELRVELFLDIPAAE